MIVIATHQGVVFAELTPDGGKVLHRALEGQNVSCLSAAGTELLAGTQAGVWRSADSGHTWEISNTGLDLLHLRWLERHPDMPELVFAGTEPAGIYVSEDGGRSWQSRPEIEKLRERHRWYLPYSPEAGCVRGFAFHGSRAYAAVEVGGVLVSGNIGETWLLLQADRKLSGTGQLSHSAVVHTDVHDVLAHPSSQDWAFACTGGGFYRTRDGGKIWRSLYSGYCRAAWVDPLNPDAILLAPAEDVERNGRIEASLDGGKSWHAAATGLATPWKRAMVERFTLMGDSLFGVLTTGELIVTRRPNLVERLPEWRSILPEVKSAQALAWLTPAEKG